MNEWFGPDAWRWIWIPALSAGLIWLATTWKTTADSRTARDARLDSRQDRELARMDAELEEAREYGDRGWGLARWWFGHSHDQRITANGRIVALGGTKDDLLPPLPALEEPIPRQPGE